jgi:hypothetical protein
MHRANTALDVIEPKHHANLRRYKRMAANPGGFHPSEALRVVETSVGHAGQVWGRLGQLAVGKIKSKAGEALLGAARKA